MTERRFFVEHEIDSEVTLENDEFNHLKNVLRLKEGDDVTLVCGNEFDYHGKITQIGKKSATVSIFEKVKNDKCPNLKITLFLGIVKNDSFSSIVTRMSELGVSKIVPFNCERAGLKPNDVKTDKMQKVANMAIKQCDMSKPLKVEEVCSFADMLTKLGEFDEVYFAYEAQNASNVSFVPSGKNIAVVVGSIGGFSEEEANKIKSIKSVKPVSLGKRIMRVETACTSLCAVLMQASGEWK